MIMLRGIGSYILERILSMLTDVYIQQHFVNNLERPFYFLWRQPTLMTADSQHLDLFLSLDPEDQAEYLLDSLLWLLRGIASVPVITPIIISDRGEGISLPARRVLIPQRL